MLKQLGSTLDEFVFRFIQFPQATWMYALKNTGEKKLLYYLHWKENASKQRLSATKLRDQDTKPEFHICKTDPFNIQVIRLCLGTNFIILFGISLMSCT